MCCQLHCACAGIVLPDALTVSSMDAGYVSPEQQIMELLMEPGNRTEVDQAKYTEFIQGWRQLFVRTLDPQHLPKGWSIEGPSEDFGGPHDNANHYVHDNVKVNDVI